MKACLQLWQQLHLNLPDNVGCCCIKPSSSAHIDYDNPHKIRFDEMINRDEMQKLRKCFLDGGIPKLCKNCGNIDEFENEEEFAEKLKELGIIKRYSGDKQELTVIDNVTELCVEFTTHCNFRCIYCVHSNEIFNKWAKHINIEKFYKILDIIQSQMQLKKLITIGLGEFTVLPDWEEVIQNITDKYPELGLNIFSNFGKVYKESEIAELAKAKKLTVSCDTDDEQLFKRMRSGNLNTILNNLRRVIEYKNENNQDYPEIEIACVVNSESIKGLEKFAKMLGEQQLCNTLMLSPMNLPPAYAEKIGIFPVLRDVEHENIRNRNIEILRNIRNIGDEYGMNIFYTGKFSNKK